MADIISPIDGKVAFSVRRVSLDEALTQLGAAERATAEWRKVPVPERAELCRKMLQAYRARLDENAQAITRMMGKPLSQSRGEFEGGFRERTLYLSEVAEAALADLEVGDKPGFRRFIRHDPVGVVLDIAAWNYPLLIACNVIVPAVLAGDSVLVKHASQTALVADQLERAFTEAGAPAGLVSALHVGHDTAAGLLDTRRIGYVSFTGSVRGGREVYRNVARENFIGVGMELGGKDPAYVRADADLDFTVENLVDGAFYNAGQSCCAVERIYVHQSLFERFRDAFVALTEKYVVGNPLESTTTIGPLVDEQAAEHVRGQGQAAEAAGARQLCDQKRFNVPDLSRSYLAPLVYDRVDQSMELMQEETFGPAIGIMAVRDDDQGIARMNDCKYGLTGSIWTTDSDVGEKLADRVEAGTVYVNRCDYLDPALAWTGVKDSGFGCSLSVLGFRQVTRPRSFHVRHRP
jgi:acyl-CoA reductase-like NAD-dependent aldehyde dehydrogenase